MGLVFYGGSLISPGIRRSDLSYAAALQQWVLIPLGEIPSCVSCHCNLPPCVLYQFVQAGLF